MSKKDEFREFVKTKPELVDYVNNNEMTWQKFYEMYDLYGSKNNVWSKYTKENRASSNISDGINKITDIVKSVDMESIKGHINTAQKALDLVQELTSKKNNTEVINNISKGPSNPRPLNKFFED